MPSNYADTGPKLPLSFSQEGLWFLEQLTPGDISYNVPLVFDLDGPLDVGAFQRAVVDLVARHEALRTTFPSERGIPYQRVEPAAEFPVPVTDLSSLPAADRDAEVDAVVAAEIRRPFDLSSGPIFRARLLRLALERHVFVSVVHHIVYDGWSNAIVFRELAALYHAYRAGEPSPLGGQPARFVDFAMTQRERLQGAALEREIEYWKTHLGIPPRLVLAADRCQPAALSLEGHREYDFLPESVIKAVSEFSRRVGVTLFVAVLAAFAALLHLNSGQRAVVIGIPMAGRTERQHEGTVGYFLNVLPLRIDLGDKGTFRELLQDVKRVAFSGYAHQDLPFDKLVHELRPERRLGRTPIIDTMFVLDNNPGAVGATVQIGELTLKRRVVHNGTAKSDVGLMIFPTDGGYLATLEYRRDLFEASTAARLLKQYRRLLDVMVESPDTPVSRLLRPSDDQAAQILNVSSGHAAPYPRDRTLDQLVKAVARERGDAVAIIDAHGALTYSELNRRANQLAHRLRAAGVQTGSRVGVSLNRSAQTIVTLLGIVKAGAAYVPLDPTYPRERLRSMMERGQVQTVVTTNTLARGLPLQLSTLIELDREQEAIARLPDREPSLEHSSESLAYVLFTSGTTGDPKPVGVQHRPIARLAYGMPEIPFGAGSRVLYLAPLAFDLSTLEIWVPLLRGGTVVVSPSDLPTPVELERILTTHGVTVLWLTASLFNLVVDEHPTALRTVRYVITGGEALSVSHVQRAIAAMPNTTFVNGYGPTEATTFATYHLIDRDDLTRSSIPIGRPLANTRVYVLDDDRHLVAPGLPGELWIGGDAVAVGYLDDPALTAERFVPDPFADPPARMYRSGDRVRLLENGLLEYLGRTDDQVKIRGVRIEPGEIEAALMAHPGVERAAVAAHDLSAFGRTLVAYVVARNGDGPSINDLKTFLRARLPERLVPHHYETLAALPLLPNGKIDRRALNPPSDAPTADKAGSGEDTFTPVEDAIVRVWRPLLRLDRINRQSNFFELGGDSLLAAQAVGRLGVATGVELSVRSLFEFPTVAGHAKILEEYLGASPQSVTSPANAAPSLSAAAHASNGGAQPDGNPPLQKAGEIEAVLSEIWRGIFGVSSIDPDDNFFELGGHSLMAVRVMSEIESRLGVTLSLATLFEHSTLRDQCRLIQSNYQVEMSPLVAIRPGGSKAPLFLIHAIGGEVLSYQPLVARLKDDRPVYGLRVETRDGLPVHATVEKMAASYVRAIREVQPGGPYNLGGYSGGGLIAFEVAQQLRALGDQVGLLAMIDCRAPGWGPEGFSAMHWLHSPIRLAQWVMDDDFVREGWTAALARIKSQLLKILQKPQNGDSSPEFDVRHALGLWRYPEESRQYLTVIHVALESYQPRGYDGAISVIQARSGRLLATAPQEPNLGWHRLVSGPIHVEVVRGAHDTIAQEPRVRELAAALSRLLDEKVVG